MVDTQPHGEGNVRDHINRQYDTDENGLIDQLDDNIVREATIDGSAGAADEVLVSDGQDAFWQRYPLAAYNSGGQLTSKLLELRFNSYLTASSVNTDGVAVDFDASSFRSQTDASDFSGSAGTAGQVLTTDGTNATWSSPSSGGEWTEDGTFGNSGTSSVSYTLNNQWDQVRVVITSDSSTAGIPLDFRINGNTTGYSTRLVDGNASSEGFIKHVLTSGYSDGGVLHLDGTWGANFTMSVQKGVDWTATSPAPAQGGTYSGGSTLSSIEIFDDAANSFSIQGKVLGKNE